MDETITGQDSTINETPVEETTAPELEINLDEETAEPQVETVPKSQYSQVFARAKKAEEALKAYQTKKPLEEKHDDIRSTVAELKLAETKRQFGYENGLSPEQTDFVYKINTKPSKELLEDAPIKAALKAIEDKKKVADNTPRASRSSGFTLPTKKTPLTADEKQEAFDKAKREKMGE